MNKLLKDESVKKIIISGTILILIYWGINNIDTIGSYISFFFKLITPFIVGAVIAFIFNVPMRSIEKHLFKGQKYNTPRFARLRRVCSYLITLLFIILVLAVVLMVLIPQLTKTIMDLLKAIPGAATNLQNWAISQLNAFPQIEEYIKNINIDWQALLKSAATFLSDSTMGVITGGIGAVSGIISGVTTFFIGFVFSIYVLFQKETLSRQAKKIMYALMTEQKADRMLEILSITDNTFANFLSGQCLEACILGSMFVITMSVLRMPYALLVGVLIAVTALIPIVGAFIGCIVGAILICISNPMQAIGFVALFLILQQIEGNLIYPHVVGSSVGLPGIWVLVAVTVGGNLFGVVGMLTFIPICSVIYALFRVYINRRIKAKGEKVKEE